MDKMCGNCKDKLSDFGLCNSGCSEYPPVDLNLVPIGLTPAFTVYEPRLQAIEEAIERYVEAGKDIPFKWLKEKSNLVKYFIK